MKVSNENIFGEFGNAIGKGLLAGVAGTAAISLSQYIEMSITKRKPSDATVKVASQITDVKPVNKDAKEKVSQEIHWAYGTAWGVARGLVGLTGLKGLPAAAVHFAAIWGTSMVMLPKYNAAKPITEQEPKAIAIDAMHHAVYALAAGAAYDALDYQKQEQKLEKVVDQMKLKGLWKKFKK
jgi:hypothetical protein